MKFARALLLPSQHDRDDAPVVFAAGLLEELHHACASRLAHLVSLLFVVVIIVGCCMYVCCLSLVYVLFVVLAYLVS